MTSAFLVKRLLGAAMLVALSPVFEAAECFWIRDRISRCPASPIKRSPANRDELLETTDYYTEDFLSQTAGEGVNGLSGSERVQCGKCGMAETLARRLSMLADSRAHLLEIAE